MSNESNLLEIEQAIQGLCDGTDGYDSLLEPFIGDGSAAEKAAAVLINLNERRYFLCECEGSDHNAVDDDRSNYDDPSAHAVWCPHWIRAALVAVTKQEDLPQ